MGEFLNIKDLFTSSPKNIKRRLFRDIAIILLCTTCAIAVFTIIQGSSTKKEISAAIITESTHQVKKRFQEIFRPATHDLELIARWGQNGLLDFSKPEKISALLGPLLDLSLEKSVITLYDHHKTEITLLKKNSALETIRTEPVTGKAAEWKDGAINQPLDQPIFWTDLYIHPVLKEKTLTAAIAWNNDSGEIRGIAAISITVAGVLNLMDRIAIPEYLCVLVFDDEGMTFSSFESRIDTNLPGQLQVSAADYATATELAVKRWEAGGSELEPVINFQVKGNRWWAGFSPLRTESDPNKLAILLPEKHIMQDVQSKWLMVLFISMTILLTGLLLAAMLVRKYSSQLKDLPIQSLAHDTYLQDIRKLLKAGESASVEFKSSVRMNLKTGKTGKEIELAWLKSVSAFMNSDGGLIILGVNDDGVITGVEVDEFQSDDKCMLHCKNLITTHIGAEFSRYIHLRTLDIDDHTIVVIECERVRKPVFLRIGKTEEFYIRSGPSSIKLTTSQIVKYLSDR